MTNSEFHNKGIIITSIINMQKVRNKLITMLIYPVGLKKCLYLTFSILYYFRLLIINNKRNKKVYMIITVYVFITKLQ